MLNVSSEHSLEEKLNFLKLNLQSFSKTLQMILKSTKFAILTRYLKASIGFFLADFLNAGENPSECSHKILLIIKLYLPKAFFTTFSQVWSSKTLRVLLFRYLQFSEILWLYDFVFFLFNNEFDRNECILN